MFVYCSMGWVLLLVIVALTVQWLPLHDPTTVARPDFATNLPPSWSPELLGTDAVGRSILSRLAYGARVSIGISFLSTVLAMVVGWLLGLVTAYFGRWVTVVVDILANVVLAVPALLLLLAIMLALRPTLPTLICALSLTFIPAFMRLTRANAQTQLSRDFVVAARSLGASTWRILFAEVLPNTILPLLSYATLVLPGIIVTEGSLSFLGFGVQPPTPSWGAMIAQGQATLSLYPWPALIPCMVLFLTVLSLNTLGDWVRVRFDAREAQL